MSTERKATVKLVSEENAPGKVAKIFEDIKKTKDIDFVPNLWRVLATNPNFEGDGTALYIADKLSAFSGLIVSRIARGMPSGSNLEHVSKTIVADALEGRRSMEN